MKLTIGRIIRSLITRYEACAFPVLLNNLCDMTDRYIVLEHAFIETVQQGRADCLLGALSVGGDLATSLNWVEIFGHMRMRWQVEGGEELVEVRMEQLWPVLSEWIRQQTRPMMTHWSFAMDSARLASLART
jgi:hypothetical protein